MHRINVPRSKVKALLAATFPDYKGRKIAVEFCTKLTFYNTNWDGGSRNYYHAVAADGRHSRLSVPAPWANPVEGATVEMPTEALVIERSIFCGQDCGVTIYAHPTHAPKWLEAG